MIFKDRDKSSPYILHGVHYGKRRDTRPDVSTTKDSTYSFGNPMVCVVQTRSAAAELGADS